MRKIITTILLIAGLAITSFAQKNVSPELKAERKMKSVEMKMKKEKADEEGVKLIYAHDKALKSLQGQMRQVKGYGKAATSKQALAKFRAKTEKKDPKFKTLGDKERETRKAKEDYIAGVNEDYKKAIPLAKLVK